MKRILIPNMKYSNISAIFPKLFETVAIQQSITEGKDKTSLVGFILCYRFEQELHCPVYFLGEEIADSLFKTEISPEIKFSDLKWPAPVIMFVFPQTIIKKYCGNMIDKYHFSLIGIIPDNFRIKYKNYRAIEVNQVLHKNTIGIFHVYQQFNNETMSMYHMNCPETLEISQIHNIDMEDYGEMIYTDKLGKVYTTETRLKNDDKEINNKLNSLVIKSLLLMNSSKNLITPNSLARKQRIKNNKVRDELWHPNFIGLNYKSSTKSSTKTNMTHASPRLHFRRGYFRKQHYGRNNLHTKIVWIDWVIVNPTDK